MSIHVDLGERGYDVITAPDARRELSGVIARRLPRARAAAVVTAASLVAQPWFDVDTGLVQHVVIVPDGEAAKTLAAVEYLCERFATLGLSRDDVVVAVGGGAVTDVAGFAAAVYLRGIAVVHVPTSLVGQVDAAVGGKTGVNLTVGKNLVGAFHQPLAVLCDVATLETLPERELRSGRGELAKCWLLERRESDAIAATTRSELVSMAVEFKASIVAADERELGSRALLNYGHTLGHAVELLVLARDANELRHGEAVSIGLAFAARLAHALGRVGDDVIRYHDAVLDGFDVPRRLPRGLTAEALVDLMLRDKKARHDLTFVLDGPNGFEVVSGIDPQVVGAQIDRFRDEQ